MFHVVKCVFKSQTVTVSSDCTHSVEQINNVWGIAVKSVIASLGNISSYIYQTNMSWNSICIGNLIISCTQMIVHVCFQTKLG